MHVNKTILVPTWFYMVCPSSAEPRHLGDAASPKGQQGWCGRCGGWCVGSSRIQPQKKSAWNSCFTLFEHLSGRKWSTSMGDFFCQVGSPGRLTYVFNCIHHVCACLCHVQPILNNVKGSPSMAKMPTLKRSLFFVEHAAMQQWLPTTDHPWDGLFDQVCVLQ